MAAGEGHEHVLKRALMHHDLGRAQRRDEPFRRVLRDQVAVIDDGNPVAEYFGFVHVMRCQQHRPARFAELCEDVPELPARLRIESCGRLVEEQQVGISCQGARDRQPLLLSSRELHDPAATLPLQFDECQQLVDRLAAVIERSEDTQRLLHGQLVGELRLLQLNAQALAELLLVRLPPATEHLHLSTVWRKQAFKDFNGRRLAGTIGPE